MVMFGVLVLSFVVYYSVARMAREECQEFEGVHSYILNTARVHASNEVGAPAITPEPHLCPGRQRDIPAPRAYIIANPG